MDLETYALIRRLHHVDHLSGREIAKKLNVSRKTVRRALFMKTYSKPKRPKRGSILDPFKPRIQELIEAYPSITGLRIFEELKKGGYPGGLTVVRDYLTEVRPRRKEVYAKLHFEPAEAFQVDWASFGTITHHGEKHRLNAFLMIACYSRYLFLDFALSATTDDFLRCHQNGFHFFGGLFRYGIYDNLKSVVLSRVGKEIHFHPRFLEFSSFYPFTPRVCRPRNPQEKGIVENAVRYVRSSFLSGRSFDSYTSIKAQAAVWLKEVANVRIHRTTGKRPVDLFSEKEKPLLSALPQESLDVRGVHTVKATHQFRVRFDSNTYTVPPEYAGQTLILKASFERITIYHQERQVAGHMRSYKRGDDIVDPRHEQAQRAAKRRVDQGLLERDFRNLSPEAGKYIEGLCAAGFKPLVHMKKILALCPLYGKVTVCQAIERALAYRAFAFEYIQNIVIQIQNQEQRLPEVPMNLPKREDWSSLTFEERNLDAYEKFLHERKTDEKEKQPDGGRSPDQESELP